MPPSMRDVIESERFAREKEAIEPDIQRMDEILDGVTWVLAVRPEIGKRTNNPDIWAIATDPWDSISLVVYYSFNERQVVLKSIRKSTFPD